MEVFEAIRTRRSIRHYKNEPVDDDTVYKILEAAHWAPSWKNTQCWRFIVVRDAETRAKIADSLVKVKFDNEFIDNAGTVAIKQAPVLIVLCAEIGKAGYGTEGTPVTDKGDWFMFDVALAMQNLVLAAHSLGLGTVHVGAFDAKKVAELLAVPRGFAVVEMTPLGYPDEQPTARKRKELAEIMSYERFTVS